MKQLNEVPCILFEQDVDPMLLNFKRQMPGLIFDKKVRATSPT